MRLSIIEDVKFVNTQFNGVTKWYKKIRVGTRVDTVAESLVLESGMVDKSTDHNQAVFR